MTTDTISIEDKIEEALAAQDADQSPEEVTSIEPASSGEGQDVKKTRRTRRTKTAAVAPETKPYELKSFTARDVPWMKLGAELPAGTVHTAGEAAHLGGLDFSVELLESGFKSSDPDGKLAKAKKSLWLSVPTRRACVRKDTQQFFSFVSADYAPVQYAEAFAFMDEISPEYVAAGTLGGGRQGFMVVKLPEKQRVNVMVNGQEDPHDLFVVLRTSHDLTRAIEVSVLTLRSVCMNALTLKSFTRTAQQRWSVKHVGKDPMAKLAAARSTLAHTDVYVREFEGIARQLGEIDLTIESAKEVLEKVLPDRPKREDTVNAIVHAWRESPNNGFRDNGWGLVNGVSEYFEWGRSEGTRTAASRFTGGLTGATHRYTNRTSQLLLRRR